MEAVDYIMKAEFLAQQYPNNGLVIAFLKTYNDEGIQSDNSLSSAKAVIALLGK